MEGDAVRHPTARRKSAKTNTAGPGCPDPAVGSGAAGAAGWRYLLTETVAGRSSAPGPGRPVVTLMSEESVRAMQKVAALTSVPPSVAGLPVREMVPLFLVGKHGVLVLLEQHSCEMPPFASMHWTLFMALQAAPLQVAVQLPLPQESSCVCGPAESPQGTEPVLVAVPVVNGSWMSRVVGGLSPSGVHWLESK